MKCNNCINLMTITQDGNIQTFFCKLAGIILPSRIDKVNFKTTADVNECSDFVDKTTIEDSKTENIWDATDKK